MQEYSSFNSLIKKRKPDPVLTQFFTSIKKIKGTMSNETTPALTPAPTSSPDPTPVPVVVEEEEKKKKPITPLQAIAIPVPKYKIPLATKEHIKWMKGYIEREIKEFSTLNRKWIITEEVFGKDLYIYADEESQQLSTPSKGFISLDQLPPFDNPKIFREHTSALYRALTRGRSVCDQMVMHFIVFGSKVDPGSLYPNKYLHMSLVNIYLRYPIVKDKDKDKEDSKSFIYEMERYSKLYDIVTTPGTCSGTDGQSIEKLVIGNMPKIREMFDSLDEALTYDIDINTPISDFDPVQKKIPLEGIIIRPDQHFIVKPKKTPTIEKWIVTKKRVNKIRFLQEDGVTSLEGGYPNFTLRDFEARFEGKPRITKTDHEITEVKNEIRATIINKLNDLIKDNPTLTIKWLENEADENKAREKYQTPVQGIETSHYSQTIIYYDSSKEKEDKENKFNIENISKAYNKVQTKSEPIPAPVLDKAVEKDEKEKEKTEPPEPIIITTKHLVEDGFIYLRELQYKYNEKGSYIVYCLSAYLFKDPIPEPVADLSQ